MDSLKGVTRDEQATARRKTMTEAVAAFDELRQAHPDLGPYEVYVKVGEKLDKHPMQVLKWVKESRADAKHRDTPFAMRSFKADGVKYSPSYVVCEELGVSNNTLREWVRYGIGPQVHAVFDALRGKVVLAYRMDEVREWRKSISPVIRSDGRKQYYNMKGKPFLSEPKPEPKPKSNGSGENKVEEKTERKFPDFDAYQSVLGKKAREEFEGTYREALKLPESPAMAHAIAQAERELQAGLERQDANKARLAQERKERAAKKAKPVKAPKEVKVTKRVEKRADKKHNDLDLDESHVDFDGKVRTIAHAVGYLKIPVAAFYAILYGYAVGYQYGVKGGGIPHTQEQAPHGRYNNRRVLTFKAADLKRWKRDEWQGYPHPVVKAKGAVIPTRTQRNPSAPKLDAREPGPSYTNPDVDQMKPPRRGWGEFQKLSLDEKRRIWREDSQRRRDAAKAGKVREPIRRGKPAKPLKQMERGPIEQSGVVLLSRLDEAQEQMERLSRQYQHEREQRIMAENDLASARLKEQQAPTGVVGRIRRIIFG